MDGNPRHGTYDRCLPILATGLTILVTAVLAAHVFIPYTSPSDYDSFLIWVGSASPTVSSWSIFLHLCSWMLSRKMRGPDPEGRYLLHVQVIAFAAGLSLSVDMVYAWYSLCQAAWDKFAERGPALAPILLILFAIIFDMCLYVIWLPTWILLRTKRDSGGGQLYTDYSKENAKLKNLVAAAEVYDEELRSQMESSDAKVEVVGEFLDAVRKW